MSTCVITSMSTCVLAYNFVYICAGPCLCLLSTCVHAYDSVSLYAGPWQCLPVVGWWLCLLLCFLTTMSTCVLAHNFVCQCAGLGLMYTCVLRQRLYAYACMYVYLCSDPWQYLPAELTVTFTCYFYLGCWTVTIPICIPELWTWLKPVLLGMLPRHKIWFIAEDNVTYVHFLARLPGLLN